MSGEDKDGKGSAPLGKPVGEAAKALGAGTGRLIAVGAAKPAPLAKAAEAKPAAPQVLEGVRKVEPVKPEASR